jgi:hypothetical protein
VRAAELSSGLASLSGLTGLPSCAACSTSATVAALSTSTARSPRTTAASVFAAPRLARLACFCQARISISIYSAPGRLNCRQGQRSNIEQRNSDNEEQLLGRKSH